MNKEIETIEELDALPAGTIIESQGQPALKVGDSWKWTDGKFWEPELNVTVIYLPENG